jgi:uncharacterized protein (TIGR03437 family)
MRRLLGLLLFAFVSPAQDIRLAQIASGLPAVTDIQSARDGSGRLFFVQQGGVIRLWRNGNLAPRPFLDITAKVRSGGERGLLGLAFPPGFSAKQRFYVNYTRQPDGATVIARYTVSADSDVANPSGEQILLTVDQPFANHNAGQLAFGPDGFLYVGLGDGGSAGDPQNNGQRPTALLGKMLRIDVETDPLGGYRVPPDNPFANNPAYRPEIWALGLRNPWRYSFDRETGDLWIADVGQNRAEEINFQPASSPGGENYGWRIMEGLRCYPPQIANCDRAGLTLPVHEYTREQGDISVTGGYVYRGARFPSLRGLYVYGDYGSGRIWGLRRTPFTVENRLLLHTNFNISTFGEDEAGEIYVADHRGGGVYRIEAEGGSRPQFTAAGVVNAASFAPGLVAGSAATVFVAGITNAPGILAAQQIPLPISLGGVSVLVNGQAAPLYAVANVSGTEQVNFQVPFEVAGAPTVAIAVWRDGVASQSVEVPLLPRQPGIFRSPDGLAVAVHNADHSLVTPDRPLEAGEYFYFYAAGLGQVSNPPLTGAASPRHPLARTLETPSVTLNGAPCEVQFAGLAPDLVGVYQVNARVPAGLATGPAQLRISIGNAASQEVPVPLR